MKRWSKMFTLRCVVKKYKTNINFPRGASYRQFHKVPCKVPSVRIGIRIRNNILISNWSGLFCLSCKVYFHSDVFDTKTATEKLFYECPRFHFKNSIFLIVRFNSDQNTQCSQTEMNFSLNILRIHSFVNWKKDEVYRLRCKIRTEQCGYFVILWVCCHNITLVAWMRKQEHFAKLNGSS